MSTKYKHLTEGDRDYFINKVKGALMYMGGTFENTDLHDITAFDLIDLCFKNHIQLDCELQMERGFPYGIH